MRKLTALVLSVAAFAFAFVATPAPDAQAQAIPVAAVSPLKLTPVSNVITAADTSPALVIKYFKGANTTASTSATTVAVEADSNLTFVVNGAAYTGFECPVAGAYGGVLDVSDAACNTLGEIVDIINSTPVNFSTGFFRAAIANGLRSDDINAGGLLADAADTEVTRPEGEVAFWDTSTLDDDEVGFFDYSLGARAFMSEKGLPKNPFDGVYSFVYAVDLDVTNAGTVGDLKCYAVTSNYGFGANDSVGYGSEVVRTIVTLPAVTTNTTGTISVFPYGFYGKNEKIFCRVDSSGADTSAWQGYIAGYTFPAQ